ncbi:MAG TPA: L-threonylcarbamoyladenylate synthase [Acidimicrobiia bacterium]|jgi:tRNA threonylcarbamoyl adenosine modification protein (Sua5/YciO/YrdC/YwlC family)|nr:L-threonylcarbamoyladenylate synthase [Acidimicrobiia bacterium]
MGDPTSSPIPAAVEAVRSGQVVGVPTDTVYGIGVDPANEAAFARLYEIKGRPSDKPISLMVGSLAQAAGLVSLTVEAVELASRHWPGPLTLVARTNRPLPDWVGDPASSTVGVRVPDHPGLLGLLAETGPLAVTSANLSGAPPVMDHEEAQAVFGEAVAVYLPGRCPGGVASTVVDVTGLTPRMLRLGPVTLD